MTCSPMLGLAAAATCRKRNRTPSLMFYRLYYEGVFSCDLHVIFAVRYSLVPRSSRAWNGTIILRMDVRKMGKVLLWQQEMCFEVLSISHFDPSELPHKWRCKHEHSWDLRSLYIYCNDNSHNYVIHEGEADWLWLIEGHIICIALESSLGDWRV